MEVEIRTASSPNVYAPSHGLKFIWSSSTLSSRSWTTIRCFNHPLTTSSIVSNVMPSSFEIALSRSFYLTIHMNDIVLQQSKSILYVTRHEHARITFLFHIILDEFIASIFCICFLCFCQRVIIECATFNFLRFLFGMMIAFFDPLPLF